MSKPYDDWGKLIWEQRGLAGLGVSREVELPGEALSLDLQLQPTGALTAEASLILGEGSRLTSARTCIELYSTRPKRRDLGRSVQKYLRVLEATPGAALWIVFAMAAGGALKSLHAKPLHGAPAGFYALGGLGVQRALVVPELPALPETLFLRLMGRDATLKHALQEALGLAEGHPLGQAVSSRVRLFRETFAGLGLLQKPPREDPMFTPEVIQAFDERMEREREALQRRLRDEIRQELKELEVERGLEQGELLVLGLLCKQRLGRPLNSAEQDGLARRLQAEGVEETTWGVQAQDAASLEAWLLGDGSSGA